MPQTPEGGGCMTPPMSPLPSPRMSMKTWWSMLSDIARRKSGLSKGGAFRLTSRLRGTFPVYIAHIAPGTWLLTSFNCGIVTAK